MNRVTIKEIAEELGLSRNTVAKALAASESVSAETRKVIVSKAIEMGYPDYKMVLPDDFLPMSTPEKKKNILILSRRETSSFWNKLILGISDVINEKQDTMQLHVVNAEDEDENFIPPEFAYSVDGIILLSVFKQSYVDKLMGLGIPVVFYDSPVHTEQYLKYGDVILPEGYNSTRILVSSMLKAGLKRFSFMGDITYCRSILDRYFGFCSALSEYSIDLDSTIMFIEHKPERYYNINEVRDAIDRCTYIPDAIICANDDIAVDVYSCLKSRGLSIPKDVAVSGFDNTDTGSMLIPELTTVHVHTQSMGRRLAKQIYERMASPDSPKEYICISTDILNKESTKKRKLF